MIARNYSEGNIDIFKPEIDYTGNEEGVLGSEFPLLNLTIAGVSKVFGYTHWYGRLINLIMSTIGIWCFFLILKQFFNEKMALFSGIMLLLSIWFMFSRKIMPDTFSVSLTICALYFAIQFLNGRNFLFLLLFIISGTAGVLSKMPAIIILAPLLFIVFHHGYVFKRTLMIGIASAFIIGALILWYYLWVPYLIRIYGNILYFPRTFSEGISELIHYSGKTLHKFTFAAFHSYLGFSISLTGLFFAFFKKQKQLILSVFFITIPFVYYMIKTGSVFSTHTYYIIPYVPILAVSGGYLLSIIKKPWLSYCLLFLFAIEAIANQQHDIVIKDQAKIKLRYESLADIYIPKNSLVLTNGGMNPQQLYFIHRKGWSKENATVESVNVVDSLSHCGLEYIFINTCEGTVHDLPYTIIHEEQCIRIYKLQNDVFFSQ